MASGAGSDFTTNLMRSGVSVLDMPSPSSGVPVGNHLFTSSDSGDAGRR